MYLGIYCTKMHICVQMWYRNVWGHIYCTEMQFHVVAVVVVRVVAVVRAVAAVRVVATVAVVRVVAVVHVVAVVAAVRVVA